MDLVNVQIQMHVTIRHKVEILSHPVQLTIKLIMDTIYHRPA